jgi:hypothetical protein
MARIEEVIAYLRPGAEWVMHNDSVDELTFFDNKIKPITKTEFDNGLKDLQTAKLNEINTNATAKAALLDRLGITSAEAALLIS